MRRLLSLSVFALAGCGGGSVSKLPDDPDRVTVFSIDAPGLQKNDGYLTEAQKGGEILYGYPVLGKVEVADPDQRRAIVAALKDGAKGEGPTASCFQPRHVVRIEREGGVLDVVICFQCWNHQVRRADDGKALAGGRMAKDAEPILNKLLADAKVPIAP